jgi:hypothetical protein
VQGGTSPAMKVLSLSLPVDLNAITAVYSGGCGLHIECAVGLRA